MFYYNNNISDLIYTLKGAVSTGEGRNTVRTDSGLAYTCMARSGINTQLSYCWLSKWEVVAKYYRFVPELSIRHLQNTTEAFSVGLSRYMQNIKTRYS